MTPDEPRRSRTGWLVLLGIVIAGGLGLYYVRTRPAEPAAKVALMKTATVERGKLEVRVRVAGATSARSFSNITAPRLTTPESGREMTLMQLSPSGSFVKKGSLIAEFDPQSSQDHLDDTVAGLKDQDNSVLKRKVAQELDLENFKQRLLQAKAAMDKARLDFRTTEIRSAIDGELLKLAVEETEQTYKELQSEMPLQLESQRADLRVTEINREKEVLHVQRHQVDIARLKIQAQADGMVVILAQPRPGGDMQTYGIGDRVNPGTTFGRVIDPKSMQVEGTINQSESSRFKIGQPAVIKLDAYPGATFKGRVDSIGALAVGGFRQNYFIRSVPIRVQILDPDPRVIPDLSAAADILIEQDDDALLAPAGAIQQEGGQTFVNVKKGDTIEKRVVTLGATQGNQVEIVSGVEPGEVVLVN